ncbi:hypothetical protein [Peribacillus butanolivorans]|nr:hypothetical protein [Peribacillus butanolivorans]
MSRYFYFNTKKLNKRMMNRLKKLDKIDNYDERKFEFRLILHELVNQEIEGNDKEELLDTFFEIGPEINDAIGISIYTDLASPGFGPLPISNRKQYRENILRELYNSKYYTSDYNFKFKIVEFNKLDNEYKNAMKYWAGKKLVSLNYKKDFVSVDITPNGEDYIESSSTEN